MHFSPSGDENVLWRRNGVHMTQQENYSTIVRNWLVMVAIFILGCMFAAVTSSLMFKSQIIRNNDTTEIAGFVKNILKLSLLSIQLLDVSRMSSARQVLIP